MRYIIIFGVTLILSLIIIFYNPNSKYLGVYNDKLTIEYTYDEENYKWIYESDHDFFSVKQVGNSKWILTPKKDGETKITYYYTNDDTIENSIYEIYYKFTIKNNKIYWTESEAKGLLDYPNPY